MSLWAVQRNRSLGCEGQEGHLLSLRSSTLDRVQHQLCEHGHSWSTCSWQLELQALRYKQLKKSGSSQLSPMHSASRIGPFQQPGFSLWSDAAYCWPTCNHNFWSYLNLCFVNDVLTSDLVSDSFKLLEVPYSRTLTCMQLSVLQVEHMISASVFLKMNSSSENQT